MPKYYPPRYLFRRYEILRSIKPAELFLEVGAGGLELSQELLRYFTRGKAIDFSPASMSIYTGLKPWVTERLIFEITDVANLPETNSYDCVISCEVMEHLEDDRDFLLNIYRQLKPQGQAILSVPAHMKFWSIHDEITGHYRRYERQEIIELLQKVGFYNIKVIGYGYPFINMLRWLRAGYATKQSKVKAQWSRAKQTQRSGIDHIPAKFTWLGKLVNPYTVLPFNWISRLFNRTDLSEGYIIIAYKEAS